MPLKELIANLHDSKMPDKVKGVANGLMYRDFITVGVLMPRDKCLVLPDNWIYIQENDVKVGRIQVFNNWSPYLVKDQEMLWLGLEYFCNENE
jgi:protoporphyrinogen oxidase